MDVIYSTWRKTNEKGDIPPHKRINLRSLAEALKCSTRQLVRLLKEGILRRHSSALKPRIRDANMKASLKFC